MAHQSQAAAGNSNLLPLVKAGRGEEKHPPLVGCKPGLADSQTSGFQDCERIHFVAYTIVVLRYVVPENQRWPSHTHTHGHTHAETYRTRTEYQHMALGKYKEPLEGPDF